MSEMKPVAWATALALLGVQNAEDGRRPRAVLLSRECAGGRRIGLILDADHERVVAELREKFDEQVKITARIANENASNRLRAERAERAREALEDMDDYARMDAGVDAEGPRETLERFIAEHERVMVELRKLSEELKADAAALRRDGVYGCCVGTYEYAAAHIDAILCESEAQEDAKAPVDERDALKAENARLRGALQAIVDEVSDGLVPYSFDSYLPAHLVEQARAALAKEAT